MPLIELRGTCKAYAREIHGYALGPIDLGVETGEYVAIVGKSGSGKTTLLNLIAGLDSPTRGDVHVDGQDIPRLSENVRARWRRSSIGVVFQFYQLLPTISVLDNLLLTMSLAARPIKGSRKDRAMALLASVGIEAQAHRLPPTLSGGQQQRAAIARALVNEPALLLMDEPTGSIDSEATAGILDLMDEFHRAGRTLVVITHDDDVAARAARRITLHDGQIAADEMRQV